ncbi:MULTISPECIES: class I SAM-dependent methyltransferase [Glycomyces]|uniref:SAM-dependent methyltransferase n=2 Tax=Glycomyces TaxID=58113 RepID=A0A9X3SY93_9ACTN|nr:class I SAM-dependent methyltransferase [Glycomyces lechevalierae]MDA1387812.1 class I SAM-dependent methyltransferase [Glycomyces lechevalierae]MDR7337445.1 SAM-dependent methyltransferase [Glycomyces lechevalierae]
MSPDAATARCFATCIPGTGRIVRGDLERIEGVRVTELGFDGRAEVIRFEATPRGRELVLRLRTVLDVFAEAGLADRAHGDGPGAIAAKLWDRGHAERVLKGHGIGAAALRVVPSVLEQRSVDPGALRAALEQLILGTGPHSRVDDRDGLEVRVSEYRYGGFVAGPRIGTAKAPDRDRFVAAVMLAAAGPAGATLLDALRGSDALRSEAHASGWKQVLDREAVATAGPDVAEAAAGRPHSLNLPDASVDAAVARPIGREPRRAVLAELARVVAPGGRVVLLASDIPAADVPATLRVLASEPILAPDSLLWTFERTEHRARMEL